MSLPPAGFEGFGSPRDRWLNFRDGALRASASCGISTCVAMSCGRVLTGKWSIALAISGILGLGEFECCWSFLSLRFEGFLFRLGLHFSTPPIQRMIAFAEGYPGEWKQMPALQEEHRHVARSSR